jgi:TolA-binding protein
MVKKLTGILLLATTWSLTATAQDNTPPATSAPGAYVKFWDEFEAYETRKINSAVKNHNEAMNSLRSHYAKEKSKITTAQVAALQKSVEKYKKQLQDHPGAPNRAYVLLNLAQVLNMIGDIMLVENDNAGTFSKNEALQYLLDINSRHPDFAQIEQANYLRAVILETMDRPEDAFVVWRGLANLASSTIYGVRAAIASGDYYFRREQAAKAMEYYQKALSLLKNIEHSERRYEEARINYRLAWSAYRAAEAGTALTAALALLDPAVAADTLEKRSRFQLDAIDIAGDALYDLNDRVRTTKTLKRPELSPFAAAIGDRVVSNYLKNSIYREAVFVGEFLAREFPVAREAPDFLTSLARAQAGLKNKQQEINALEKVAMLLPAQSFYRSKHQKSPEVIRNMEQRARVAAQAVAEYYYDYGLSTGNNRAFNTAASYYESLATYAPNDAEANKWRLRMGHSFYFAGRYQEADKIYAALKHDYKVDTDILQVAGYQHVQTNEKRWRDAFAKAMEKGENPLKDTDTGSALAELEKSIDEFTARFPREGRSIDLLLVGAGANRDMERFERASRYWQRALVSNPSDAQRGVAIRGMIFASMKTGSPYDVASITRKFLKLENWSKLGTRLETELKSVLAESSLDEGKHQNENGNALEAGMFMISIAEEFPDIPRRPRIFRDGAYLLAIGGEWAKAENAATKYLQSGLQLHKDDMVYLLARAQEYQLKLKDAAKSYFELARQFPKHIKAGGAIKRSEDLAAAEHNYMLAANAAALQAERSSGSQRLAHYRRASEYMEKAEDPDGARELAQQAKLASRTPAESFQANLLIAKMLIAKGSEQDGIDNLRELSRQIVRPEARLSEAERAALVGEVSFLLGEDDHKRFSGYDLFERDGDFAAKIKAKERMFNDLKQEYTRAIGSNHPEWSTRSRFRLAEAAQSFADEIAMIPAKLGEKVTYRSSSQYQRTAKAFADFAKKIHSDNVLVATKNPATYRDNDWVRRSKVAVNGGTYEDKDAIRQYEQLPVSYKNNLPSEWSL